MKNLKSLETITAHTMYKLYYSFKLSISITKTIIFTNTDIEKSQNDI